MAMMASATTGNPYDHHDNDTIEQDLIDPDDGEHDTLATGVLANYTMQLTLTISMIRWNLTGPL